MAEKDEMKYITIDLNNVERVWELDWYCFVKMKNNDIYLCPQYTKNNTPFGIQFSRTADNISQLKPSKSSILFLLPFINIDKGGKIFGRQCKMDKT